MVTTKNEVKRNLINIIKYVGFLTMLVDHIGMFLFPNLLWPRIVGRIAFPSFVLGVTNGVDYTRNTYKYAARMLVMGFFGNIALWRVFPLSIGFSLAVLILGLDAYKQDKFGRVVLWGILSIFTEYSLYGYFLGLALYRWQKKEMSGLKLALFMIPLHLYAGVVMNAPLQVFMVLFFCGLLYSETTC